MKEKNREMFNCNFETDAWGSQRKGKALCMSSGSSIADVTCAMLLIGCSSQFAAGLHDVNFLKLDEALVVFFGRAHLVSVMDGSGV